MAQDAETSDTTKLKERLQQHLEEVKQRLDDAKQDIADLHEQDKESIRSKTAEIKQRIEAHRQRADDMRERVAAWMEDKKQQTEEQVMSWRQKRELKHLERRADRAEEYAVNAVFAAIVDADEAESAVLDALDARLDVEGAAASAS